MSWAKKSYKKKKFRPRRKAEDELERDIARAKEEAELHRQKLEAERQAELERIAKEEELKKELEEIERQQQILRQKEIAADNYFEQKDKLWKHRLKQRKLNLDKERGRQSKGLETKMKKIQGFLKKTKQFEKHCKSVAALIKEMSKLKLGPYIDEVVKDLANANISEKEDVDKLLLSGCLSLCLCLSIDAPLSPKSGWMLIAPMISHLASALHQRFEQKFTKPFKEGILDAFRPKLDLNDESVRERQKLNLMILIEMQYLGLLKGGSRLHDLLKHVIRTETKHKAKLKENLKQMRATEKANNKSMNVAVDGNEEEVQDNNYKMEDNKNRNEITSMIVEYDVVMIHTLELMTTFIQHANEEFLAQISASSKVHYDLKDKEFTASSHDILSEKYLTPLREVVQSYFAKICDKYLELDLKLRRQKKMNSIVLIERGSVSDTRLDITCKLEAVVQGLKKNIQLFCEHLPESSTFPTELEMEDEDVTLQIDGRITSLQDAQNASFFDDEVSRTFYENLPRLKDNVPGQLLQGDVIKHFTKNSTEPQVETETEREDDIDKVNIDEMPQHLVNNEDIMDEVAMETLEMDHAEVSGKGSTGKDIKSMKDLLNAMQYMGTRKETEHLAERFCYLNSKNNRKYLASFLSQIVSDRDQSTRLPFYARYIAILNLCEINVGDRVCLALEREFYRLFFKSNKHWLMDAKMANLSYIAELTKFCIFPFRSLFDILQKLARKFSNETIELLSFFMFQCGRFLYKNPLTHYRLNKVLKYLKRRQIQTNLDELLNHHINNAIFACKPPERSALNVVKLTPQQQYIEKLLYFQLDHDNKQSVLRKLRKLPWDNPEVAQFVTDRLYNVAVVKYDRVDCIAAIIQGLNCYHPVSTLIVDNVMEEIRIGLEEEDFSQEQRRLSYVKFLGELYTYKAVNSQVVMDTLYLIVTFNLEERNETVYNFRVCLCCMLLETCGRYLRKGHLKQRCDRFLLYFQRFIILHSPFELEVEWWVADVLSFVAPNMERYHELEPILEKIKELEEREEGHKDELRALSEDDDDSDDDEYSGSDDEEDDGDDEQDHSGHDEDEYEDDDESDEDEDAADVNSYNRKKKVTKDDEEFIDEYEKMMEQYRAPITKRTSHRNLKHASVLVGNLQIKDELNGEREHSDNSSHEEEGREGAEQREGDTISFKLLTKKGVNSSKVKVGLLNIPKQVFQTMKSNQQKEEDEANLVKEATLNRLHEYEDEAVERFDEGSMDSDESSGIAELEMIDQVSDPSSLRVKNKEKNVQSIGAKRKYRKQKRIEQHQKEEDERERQRNQRNEKRKKQGIHRVTQDF